MPRGQCRGGGGERLGEERGRDRGVTQGGRDTRVSQTSCPESDIKLNEVRTDGTKAQILSEMTMVGCFRAGDLVYFLAVGCGSVLLAALFHVSVFEICWYMYGR